MSIYKGLKSADAEIIIDLEKGHTIFDYSLNKFGLDSASNNSCVLHKTGSDIARFIELFLSSINGFWILFKIFVEVLLCLLGNVFIYIPKYQHTWQKILKFWGNFTEGIIEESVIGKQESKIIKFQLDKNIWFDYNLDGDYSDKIKKIYLLRRFVKKTRLGVISQIQSGWNLTFEFGEPPQHGYVQVRHL